MTSVLRSVLHIGYTLLALFNCFLKEVRTSCSCWLELISEFSIDILFVCDYPFGQGLFGISLSKKENSVIEFS